MRDGEQVVEGDGWLVQGATLFYFNDSILQCFIVKVAFEYDSYLVIERPVILLRQFHKRAMQIRANANDKFG